MSKLSDFNRSVVEETAKKLDIKNGDPKTWEKIIGRGLDLVLPWIIPGWGDLKSQKEYSVSTTLTQDKNKIITELTKEVSRNADLLQKFKDALSGKITDYGSLIQMFPSHANKLIGQMKSLVSKGKDADKKLSDKLRQDQANLDNVVNISTDAGAVGRFGEKSEDITSKLATLGNQVRQNISSNTTDFQSNLNQLQEGGFTK